MKWAEFEDEVERLLIKYKIPYVREGVKISYGHKVRNGKYDFEIEKRHALELKRIEKLNNLTLPGINTKTHKPYTNPMIKMHQLKALRAFKGVGWLLIHESNSNTCYALTMDDLTRFMIKGETVPRTLKGIDEYLIDLEQFILKLKEDQR